MTEKRKTPGLLGQLRGNMQPELKKYMIDVDETTLRSSKPQPPRIGYMHMSEAISRGPNRKRVKSLIKHNDILKLTERKKGRRIILTLELEGRAVQ